MIRGRPYTRATMIRVIRMINVRVLRVCHANVHSELRVARVIVFRGVTLMYGKRRRRDSQKVTLDVRPCCAKEGFARFLISRQRCDDRLFMRASSKSANWTLSRVTCSAVQLAEKQQRMRAVARFCPREMYFRGTRN